MRKNCEIKREQSLQKLERVFFSFTHFQTHGAGTNVFVESTDIKDNR